MRQCLKSGLVAVNPHPRSGKRQPVVLLPCRCIVANFGENDPNYVDNCIDPATDPNNCGSCGSNVCASGVCAGRRRPRRRHRAYPSPWWNWSNSPGSLPTREVDRRSTSRALISSIRFGIRGDVMRPLRERLAERNGVPSAWAGQASR